MSRLIVRNSTLVYPPVPDSLLRADDRVLPMVDKFEETLFMAGPGYSELQALFPAFNLDVRSAAREIAAALPAWLGEPMPGFGHSVWDAYADNFAKFSLGPIAANAFLARHATALETDEVLAWELDATDAWWAGRQMVAEVAEAVGEACNAPVRRTASSLKRIFRDLILPAVRGLQVLRYFRGLRAAPTDQHASARQGPTDVLFVASGPTTIPLIDRIGARLEAEHDLRVMALETPPDGPAGRLAGGETPRGSLYAFTTPSMASAGVAEAMTIARQFPETAERLRECSLIRDLPPPLQDVLTRRLHGTMVSDLPRSLYYARLWQAALDKLQPRALVAFNAYNAVLAPAVFQARHRGIPTIMLQHGMFGPFFKAGALLPFDEVIVFNAYTRELLAAIADAHTTFTETGHCDYDDLREEPGLRAEADAIRADRLGSPDHLVVVTTQPVEVRLMANEQRWWLELLAEACAQAGALMAIKPHPEERAILPRYEELEARMPGTVRLIRHGELPLRALIAASDLLVTRFSTTAVEAALLQTPVMAVNLSGGPDQYPYVDEGAAEGVYSPEKMLPTLDRLLHDAGARRRLIESQQRFLDRHLGVRDGRATERIAARIATLAGSHHSIVGE